MLCFVLFFLYSLVNLYDILTCVKTIITHLVSVQLQGYVLTFSYAEHTVIRIDFLIRCKDILSTAIATYEKTKDDRSLVVLRQNYYLGHKIRQVLR